MVTRQAPFPPGDYLHAFTEAMKQKKWHSLHYVDLFAGAGVERLEEDGKAIGLDWGSPLIAAQIPTGFQQLHLVEADAWRAAALKTRLEKLKLPSLPQIIEGDANQCVGKVVSAIPSGSLSVAFLDPFGLHLHYNTLKQLATRRMDLIIFFPDHTDALRNWRMLYENDEDSNLDLVLNKAPWRQERDRTPPDRWPDMLTQLYREEIKKLGYGHFDYERICRTDGRHLYKLIFCSKDAAGGKIWKNISRKNRTGQLGIDFG